MSKPFRQPQRRRRSQQYQPQMPIIGEEMGPNNFREPPIYVSPPHPSQFPPTTGASIPTQYGAGGSSLNPLAVGYQSIPHPVTYQPPRYPHISTPVYPPAPRVPIQMQPYMPSGFGSFESPDHAAYPSANHPRPVGCLVLDADSPGAAFGANGSYPPYPVFGEAPQVVHLPPLPPPLEVNRYQLPYYPSQQLPQPSVARDSVSVQVSPGPVIRRTHSDPGLLAESIASQPTTQAEIHSPNHSASLRALCLSPLTETDEVVEITLPRSTSGTLLHDGNQQAHGFIVHKKLFSFFSPVFKSHLASMETDIDRHASTSPSRGTNKAVRVKVQDYVNELDFPPRVEAGPMDLEEYQIADVSAVEIGDRGGANAEADEGHVVVDIAIKLPRVRAKNKLRTVPLPNVAGSITPEAVGALVDWLYLGSGGSSALAYPSTANGLNIPSTREGSDARVESSNGHSEGEENGQKWWYSNQLSVCTLIELWVLAGRLGMKDCQNDVIVAIESERKERGVVETGLMDWVWSNTSEYGPGRDGCPLRNLLIDQCALCLDESWFDGVGAAGLEHKTILSQELLVDLAVRLKSLNRQGGIRAPGLDDLLKIKERSGNRYWVIDENVNTGLDRREAKVGSVMEGNA